MWPFPQGGAIHKSGYAPGIQEPEYRIRNNSTMFRWQMRLIRFNRFSRFPRPPTTHHSPSGGVSPRCHRRATGGRGAHEEAGDSCRQTRHAAQRPVSVYPGLKALASFRLKPVLRRRGLCRRTLASESRLQAEVVQGLQPRLSPEDEDDPPFRVPPAFHALHAPPVTSRLPPRSELG